MSRARQILFESEGLELAGTLLAPEDADHRPAVLMLPGSGETDRDDNAPRLAIDAFPQIATSLASIGFASLRYDKRGIGRSQGNYWKTGFHDHVVDATAALSWLCTQPEVDSERIYVLGHSEGSLLAIRLAAQGAPMAGIILLAGSAQTGEQTMIWQAQRLLFLILSKAFLWDFATST